MKIMRGLLSLLCLLGSVMCQGRFYRRDIDRGSRGPVLGRSRTADFFNSNLQLDAVAPLRGHSIGRPMGGSMGGAILPRSFGGAQQRSSRMGQSIQEDPTFIRRILGSTVQGRELRMGEMGLPRHGGAGIGERHADGRNNGWDGNPQTLTTQYQGWSDPFDGQPIPQLPLGFNGDFGSVRGLFGDMGIPPVRAPTQFL